MDQEQPRPLLSEVDSTSVAAGSGDIISAHSSVVRVCKFCRSTSDDVNPLIYQRAKKPRLPWRRALRRECSICPWVIDGDADLKSCKVTLPEDLKEETRFKAFLEKRNNWVAEKNKTGGSHIKHQQPAATSSVTASTKASVETRELLGHLWPMKLWKAKINEGKRPSRVKTTTITHMGKPVQGVMMSYSCPEGGSIEVYNLGSSAVEQAVVLADGSSSSAAELNASYQSAASRVHLDSSTKSGDIKLSGVCGKRKHAEDEEDDDLLLDNLWGRSLVKSDRHAGGGRKQKDLPSDEDPGDAGAAVAAIPPRKNTAKIAKTPKRFTSEAGGSPLQQHKANSGQRGRDFDQAENVLLKCDQLVSSLGSNRFSSLAPNYVQSLIDKVDGRLTAEQVMIYSGGGGVEETRGMTILQRLRHHQKQLPTIKKIVVCIKATEGHQASAAASDVQLSSLREIPLAIHGKATELLSHRRATECISKQDWKGVLDHLVWAAGGEKEGGGVSINSLAEDDARDMQTKLLVKIIYDLCRLEDARGSNSTVEQDEAMAAINNLVQEVGKRAVLDAMFKKDIASLRALSAMACSESLPTEDEAAAAVAAKNELLANKQGFFFRALTLFATGMRIVHLVSQRISLMELDRAHRMALNDLASRFGSIQPSTPEVFVKDGRVTLSQAKVRAGLCKDYANIIANATSSFKTANGDALKLIQDRFEEVVRALEHAANEQFVAQLSHAVKQSMPCLSPNHPAAVETVGQAWQALVESIIYPTDIEGYDGVAEISRAQAFHQTQHQKRQDALKLTSNAAWMVAMCDGQEVGLDLLFSGGDDVLCALDQLIKDSQDCADVVGLRDWLLEAVMSHAEKSICEGLSSCTAFVRAFRDGTAEEVFTPDLTGKDGSEHLQQLIEAADKVHEALMPRLPDFEELSVTLSGELVEWPFTVIAPRLLAVGQALARSVEAREVSASSPMEAIGAAATLLHEHLPAVLQAMKGVHQWAVPSGTSRLKFKVAAAEEFFQEQVKALVGTATSRLENAGTTLQSSMQAAFADECVQALLSLLGPTFSPGDIDEEKRDRILAAFSRPPVRNIYEGFKAVIELENTTQKAVEHIQRLQGMCPWATNSLPELSSLVAMNDKNKAANQVYGSAVATWTCAQAMFRTLEPGENRRSLAARVARGVTKRRYHVPVPAVMQHLECIGGIGTAMATVVPVSPAGCAT